MKNKIAEQVCRNKHKHSVRVRRNKQHPSAGRFFSIFSASAVTLLILLPAIALGSLLNVDGNASAYTLSVSTSTAKSIDVYPGTDDAGNVGTSISADDIEVITDCKAGYNFSLSTTVNDNNLYLNGSSSNNVTGTYIAPSSGSSTLVNSPNTWGYYYNSTSTDAPTKNNVFNAMPILGNATVIRTPSSTASETNIDDTFSIYYGVSASPELSIGTYKMPTVTGQSTNGAIIYYATMADACTKDYMQDETTATLAEKMPNEGDTYDLYDKRDDQKYSVAKINGNYWMTDNLLITGTVPSTDSNFNNISSWNVSAGDLDSAINPSGYASYTAARYHEGTDSNGDPTVWYNFCAASANNSGGCVSGTPYTEASGDVTGDICPYGWKLPTKDDFTGIVSNSSAFNPVGGGNWYSGTLGTATMWWSSTNAYEETGYGYRQYYLSRSAAGALSVTQNNTRRGEYIRCVKINDSSEVTVNLADNVTSVTLSNDTYGSETVTASGSKVFVKTGATYNITMTKASGTPAWTSESGTIGSAYSAATTYTVSSASDTLTATSAYNLVITADSYTSAISVKKGSTSGTSTSCTKSSTTFTCGNLIYGTNYYLYPTFSTGHAFSSWTKTDSATGAALSSTSDENAYYTVGTGAGTLTLVSKSSRTYMQSMVPAQCATTPTTVYDNRDNTAYVVQKLADGNCWMLDNLALDIVAKIDDMNENNTNASNTTLGYLKNGGGSTVSGDATYKYASAGIDNWASSYPYSIPLQNATVKDTAPSNPPSDGKGGNKIGVYYNYCAATAGSYCYGDGTSEGTSTGNATEDICPKGWRLPTGYTSGEFSALANAIYGATSSTQDATAVANYRNALSLPLSGSTSGSRGSTGYWWSSTRYGNSYRMYTMRAETMHIVPQDSGFRTAGYNVRCIMSLPYMQDQTSATMAAILPNTGDTTTLYDKRDNQAYNVAKLADGKYWMLDNLALDLVAKKSMLSSSNTNASATTLNYLKGTSTGTTSDKYATAAVANWTSSYSYSAPLVNMSYKDTVPTDATSTAGGWKIGGYYNYCAATAGSYCYGNGTSAGTSSGSATEDICPKGWRMPTGSSSGEFQTLYNNASYNTYANYRAALHLPLSGYFTNGSPNDPGTGGSWWSSTRSSNYNMYYLYADTSGIFPAGNDNRRFGDSLRCIIGS